METHTNYILTTLGIFICFLLNGLYTEYNAEHTYGGRKFKFPTFYIIFQSVLMIIFTVALKLFTR